MERKKPVSDLEIGRRLAGYPPEFLLYMGLISKKECSRIRLREHSRKSRDKQRLVF